MDLHNIGYQDDPWVVASHVTRVFYMTDPLSIVPQRRNLSMWLSLENNTLSELMALMMLKPKCDQMPLFTDFINKIGVVEKNLPIDVLPWERKGVKWKTITVADTNK